MGEHWLDTRNMRPGQHHVLEPGVATPLQFVRVLEGAPPEVVRVPFKVIRSHQQRRWGWRGRMDWLLRRKPVTIIDEVVLL